MNDDIYEFYGLSSLTHVPRFKERGRNNVSSSCVIVFSQMLPWVTSVARKLESLARLDRGWDSHDGLPLSPESRRRTVETIRQLGSDNLPVPNVVLNSCGSVGLEWEEDGRELELGIGPEEVEYLTFDSSGVPQTGQVQADSPELRKLAKWLVVGSAATSQKPSTATHGSAG